MRILLFGVVALILLVRPVEAKESYAEARAAIELQRRSFLQAGVGQETVSAFILHSFETLSTHWMGTKWGRGKKWTP